MHQRQVRSVFRSMQCVRVLSNDPGIFPLNKLSPHDAVKTLFVLNAENLPQDSIKVIVKSKKYFCCQIFHFLTTPHSYTLYTRIRGKFQKDHLGHQEEKKNAFKSSQKNSEIE